MRSPSSAATSTSSSVFSCSNSSAPARSSSYRQRRSGGLPKVRRTAAAPLEGLSPEAQIVYAFFTEPHTAPELPKSQVPANVGRAYASAARRTRSAKAFRLAGGQGRIARGPDRRGARHRRSRRLPAVVRGRDAPPQRRFSDPDGNRRARAARSAHGGPAALAARTRVLEQTACRAAGFADARSREFPCLGTRRRRGRDGCARRYAVCGAERIVPSPSRSRRVQRHLRQQLQQRQQLRRRSGSASTRT